MAANAVPFVLVTVFRIVTAYVVAGASGACGVSVAMAPETEMFAATGVAAPFASKLKLVAVKLDAFMVVLKVAVTAVLIDAEEAPETGDTEITTGAGCEDP